MPSLVSWPAFIVPLFLFGGALWFFLHARRHARLPDDVLQDWLVREKYRVLSRQHRALFRGPFTWTTRRGQAVYLVTLEDELSRQRTAWVRCSLQLWGDPIDPVEVVWVD